MLRLFLALTLLGCRPNTGFFSHMDTVLDHLRSLEGGELSGLEVSFTCTPYAEEGKGSNWWEYYFEPLHLDGPIQPIDLSHYKPDQFNPIDANYYIQKYIKIKPHILEKVNDFSKNFNGYVVIGVHYRGTDKQLELKRTPYEPFLSSLHSLVKHYAKKRPFKIFVATDERPFLDLIRTHFGTHTLSRASILSDSDKPLHLDPTNIYLKGEEALIDSLLLSRCDVLLRPLSNLSRWSTYFNPYMPEFWLY